jgi:hypothetical protein
MTVAESPGALQHAANKTLLPAAHEPLRVDIAHQIPGRLRAIVPELRDNEVVTRSLERILRHVRGVNEVRVNPLARSLIVDYDPDVLASDALLRTLRSLTPRHLMAPRLRLRHHTPASHQVHDAHSSHGVHEDGTHGHVSTHVKFESEHEESLVVTAHGVHAHAHVATGAVAEFDAVSDSYGSLFGGAVKLHAHFEEQSILEVMVEADVHCDIEIDLAHHHHLEIDIGFEAEARAIALSRGMAEFDITIAGWRFGVEGFISYTAGGEIEIAGWLKFHDGVFRVGLIAGAGVVASLEFGGGLVLGISPPAQEVLDQFAAAFEVLLLPMLAEYEHARKRPRMRILDSAVA